MSYEVYKKAIMESLPAAPVVPLDAPPVERFDSEPTHACPACGGSNNDLMPVDGVDMVVCRDCQCEFSPRMESVSKQALTRIRERRDKRAIRFMEQLPVKLPGVDPVDYELFKKVVDEIGDEDEALHPEAVKGA